MAMDVLRSCYRTEMKFWSNSDVAIPVRWYWCKPGAKVFPGHHRFGSGNWASKRENWPGVGEVLGVPRPWDRGEPLPLVTGQQQCGSLETFENGALFDGIEHTPRTNQGVPLCCLGVQVGVQFGGGGGFGQGVGGVLVGGAGIFYSGPPWVGSGGVLLDGYGLWYHGPPWVGTGGVLIGGAGERIASNEGGVLIGGAGASISNNGGLLFGGTGY